MADHRLTRDEIDIAGVYHGRHAATAVIGAFLDARGRFDVTVTLGVETERPDLLLVLVEINDTKAVFRPSELRAVGELIARSVPFARRLGASEVDVHELRHFAAVLIRNAEEAKAVSPHGLH